MEIGRFAFLRPPMGDLGTTYGDRLRLIGKRVVAVSYTHLRAHETDSYLVCRLLLEKKTQNKGYYGVQGHSRSSRSVPMESRHAIAY